MHQEKKDRAGKSCCEGGAEMFGFAAGGAKDFSAADMKKMMKGCPCGDVLKRHRFAVFTSLAVIGLGFLVLQAGWVLGVVAFFRTF